MGCDSWKVGRFLHQKVPITKKAFKMMPMIETMKTNAPVLESGAMWSQSNICFAVSSSFVRNPRQPQWLLCLLPPFGDVQLSVSSYTHPNFPFPTPLSIQA